MKKNRQKADDRPLNVRARDLASVRGGSNGLIHSDATVGSGAAPRDNGVISAN